MELEDLNKKLDEGSTYYVKSGEYPKSKIKIKSSGTLENPIHIVAQDVIISNKSYVHIKGSNIIFEGFTFQNVDINKMIRLEGDNIVFRNNVIEGLKRDVECIIRVTGQYCRLMDNRLRYFDKKGCLIVVQHTEEKPSYCLLDGNTFGDRRKGEGNGYEIIRIGDSNSSLWDSKTILHNNSFNMCNGEIEVVSVKSCKNVIHNNKFFNNEGGLCLRHGRDNVVAYNFFEGLGTENSAGIRICGKGHKVFYNTLRNIESENPFRSSLSIMCGELNNELNGYEPVENVEIKHNDFIYCRDVMSIGVNNKRRSNVKPKNLIITDNRLIKCVGMFNMDKKVLGYEESKITDNKILKYDQKYIIKKPIKKEKINIEELWNKLYHLEDVEEIKTKDDKDVEEEINKDKEEKKDITEIVSNRFKKLGDREILDNDDEEKEDIKEDVDFIIKDKDEDDMMDLLEEMRINFKLKMEENKKRMETMKKLINLLK